MALIQRLSPITDRLAHILSASRARRTLESKWAIGKPVLAIFFGGLASDLYQVQQWLPVFEEFQDELPTIILMKDATAALKLARTSRLPIRLAGSADAIEPLASQWDLRAMFYVNNNLANFSVLRLASFKHIHLSHGESEKASMTSNQLKAYDYCFVAGQASADRIMSALPLFERSHLKLVGRPQLEHLVTARPFPAAFGRKSVLYAPTWEGDRPAMAYSSVADAGEAWITELLADDSIRVIYRPHPKTGTRDACARAADQRIRGAIESAVKAQPEAGHLVDTGMDCNPAMISADVAIFDMSAMAMDFSVLDRPYFVSVPAAREDALTVSELWKVARPLRISEPQPLALVLSAAIEQGPLGGSKAFIMKHFGEVAATPGITRFRAAIQTAI